MTMRFLLSTPVLLQSIITLSSTAEAAAAKTRSIPLTQKLWSESRSLEANQDVDFSFVSKYAVKFQGCHAVSQWNEEAGGEEDVRIATKRLVRFRLCPISSCVDDSWAGCDSDYGDYVVDLNTFANAYYEQLEGQQQYACEQYKDTCQNQCDGNGNENCEYNCYVNAGMEYCAENEGDYDDVYKRAQAEFDPLEYVECGRYEFNNNNNNNNNNNQNVEYFIGPFCADQGGSINLGLFMDDTCTAFVEDGDQYFLQKAGFELPYSNKKDSMIPYSCMSCNESDNQDQNGQNWNDMNDNDEVSEICEQLYKTAGKCETKMSSSYYPNENACSYIEGIKVIKNDGSIKKSRIENSQGATITIGIFTTAAVLLAAYVSYLKTKIGRAKITLLE